MGRSGKRPAQAILWRATVPPVCNGTVQNLELIHSRKIAALRGFPALSRFVLPFFDNG